MDKLIFSKITKRLSWGTARFYAKSGGFGKGPLPNGLYEIRKKHVVVNPPESGFKDELTGKSWFIPLLPSFQTSRGGFGIHPDGSPVGTKGCIGLQGEDTDLFWQKWMATPMAMRPSVLEVK